MTMMQAAFGQEGLLTDIIKAHPHNDFILLEPDDDKSDFQVITFDEANVFSDPFKYEVIVQIGKQMDGYFAFMYFDLDGKLVKPFLAACQNLVEQNVNTPGLNKLMLLKYQIKNDIQYVIISAWHDAQTYQVWHDEHYLPAFDRFINIAAKIESYHEALYHQINLNEK